MAHTGDDELLVTRALAHRVAVTRQSARRAQDARALVARGGGPRAGARRGPLSVGACERRLVVARRFVSDAAPDAAPVDAVRAVARATFAVDPSPVDARSRLCARTARGSLGAPIDARPILAERRRCPARGPGNPGTCDAGRDGVAIASDRSRSARDARTRYAHRRRAVTASIRVPGCVLRTDEELRGVTGSACAVAVARARSAGGDGHVGVGVSAVRRRTGVGMLRNDAVGARRSDVRDRYQTPREGEACGGNGKKEANTDGEVQGYGVYNDWRGKE